MNTKYLNRFNQQLKMFREKQRLSREQVAKLCLVDTSVVQAWELEDEKQRCFPSLDNLLDLCFKTGTALETFVDIPESSDTKQLDLPGLAFLEDADLAETLDQLDHELDKLIPAKEEIELLKKFRKSNKQNRELILQLIGH